MPKKGGAKESGVEDMPMPPAPEMPMGPDAGMPPMDGGVDMGMAPEPIMGPEDGMDNAPEAEDPSSGDVKKIQKATGTLSNLLNNFHSDDEDEKEELKKYVEGMIDSAIEKLDDMGDDEPMPDEPEEGPGMPMESVRFTKGQLKRVNEGINDTEDDNEKRSKKLSAKEKKGRRKSPFDAPKFR